MVFANGQCKQLHEKFRSELWLQDTLLLGVPNICCTLMIELTSFESDAALTEHVTNVTVSAGQEDRYDSTIISFYKPFMQIYVLNFIEIWLYTCVFP